MHDAKTPFPQQSSPASLTRRDRAARDSASAVPLSRALQDLPLLSPPRSAWDELQAAVAPQRRSSGEAGRRTRRVASRPWPLYLAAAAALALVALLPRWLAPGELSPPPPTLAATSTPAGDDAQLRALMDESAQLEAMVEWARSERVESAPMASLAAGVQARVVQIDALLARTDADPRAAVPLWQERVLRLRQMVELENTQQLLAANGDVDPGVPVLAF